MKIVLLTNIPAPYRLPIYQKIAQKYGQNFIVIFSAKSESNRMWNLENFKFQHIFLKENIKAKKDGFNYVHNNIDVLHHLKDFNPDVIITTGFNPTHLYAWLYSVILRKKHIPMTDGWLESEKNLSFIHKFVRKVIFKTSHAFIGASKNSLNLYKSYEVNKNRLFQSHLCIDNKRFENNKLFKDREYDLMFSGHIAEHKLPLFFEEVAEKISKSVGSLKVLILGDGPLKEEFFGQFEKASINYHYAGFVTQEELPKYYSNSKLFLFTTKMDAWGIVVNEALASGTPVITTKYAGVVNDLLINQLNGFVLDIDSDKWSKQIIEILSNKNLWQGLSMNAKESVKEFNFDNAAKGIINASEYAYEK
jgi:glycosyltransferase involved in cell wall biosynthesis